ncbi:type VI secretion system Vgr family protein [Spiribacter halobius]|nr:type VI secretion system tip protein VgrG [Spiribacter halobius]UEX76674.1 type VI secretion system tip protein VgrG [Spiribacter halobius]
MSTPARDVTLAGALGDRLIVRRLSGTEQLGRPFEYTVELLGTDEALAFPDVLGQPLTVRMSLPDGGARFFNGFVTRFAQLGRSGRHALFQAHLRPWLWYLSRCSDCRIFQERSVPEIVQAVFREHGFSDFEDSLSGSYDSREYCVQYRESDLQFVSRLLEEEGIYFFFRHEEDRHTLVMADDYAAHAAPEGYEEVPYYPPGNEAGRERDHISDWLLTQEIQPELYALRDFDFEKPRANLEAKGAIERQHSAESYEVYDYPGGYREKSAGERYARVRVEEQQARFERVRGTGNVRGLGAGALFRLRGYPRDDQNREYLVTGASFEIDANPLETREVGEGTAFSCAFTAMDSQEPFRPVRSTPRPVVQGPQTAVVVGQSGQDIWTDKYGRVKVQFHWDREGSSDENSSCWVRVSQNWAGRNWGGMFLPHIGHEVLVSFLEGDPDRPIITGRVYNADNMPPEDLPSHKTKSIIRDYGDNEMVWEGKEGEQFIRINQKCGNQLIMNGKPGEESVSLSDKFGNLLLMDAVGRMIALRSPSKSSGLVLGKSKHEFTESDSFSVTGGMTGDVFMGSTSTALIGSKLITTLGHSMSVSVGSASSLSFGHTLEYANATKVTLGKSSSYSKTSKNNTLAAENDVTLDASDTVWILGGSNDQSIVKADRDELMLSYYSGSAGRDSVSTPGWRSLTGSSLGLAAHLVAQGRQYMLDHGDDAVDPIKKGEAPSPWAGTCAMVEAGGSGLAGLVGGFAAWALGAHEARAKDKAAEQNHDAISMHRSPEANMRLSKQGVKITANNGKSRISIDDKDHLEVNAKGKVDIYSQDQDILLAARGEVVFQTETTTWKKGVIRHKNFQVD